MKRESTITGKDLTGNPTCFMQSQDRFGDVVGGAQPSEGGSFGYAANQPRSRGAGPSMAVSVTPGAIPFTRSVGAHSNAATAITMSRAAFDTQ